MTAATTQSAKDRTVKAKAESRRTEMNKAADEAWSICPEWADADAAIYASFGRVLQSAPIENKMVVYGLVAKSAASDAAAIRQDAIDGLWMLAADTGLVALIGTATVQGALSNAFGGVL
jgi:hypothetical protein